MLVGGARAQGDRASTWSIGVVETHGRAETEALLAGLERLPLEGGRLPRPDARRSSTSTPRSRASRRWSWSTSSRTPTSPGSRHPKRWQDVEELLDAGIDVWTTMNVQHLESLNDVVSGITGIRVWETVPDRVFDEADEVVLVDLPPDDLLQRLKEGKVYLPQQAERAVRNFFRKGNLIALRELALRRTADRVDDEMLQYRRTAVGGAGVADARGAAAVHRPGRALARSWCAAAARLAAQLDVPWHCVYVETPQLQRCPTATRQRVLRVLKLAQEPAPTPRRWPAESLAGGRRASTRASTTCRAWCSAATPAPALAVAAHAGRGGRRSSAATST